MHVPGGGDESTSSRGAEGDGALADDLATVSLYTRQVDRGDERLNRVLDRAPAVSLHDHPFRYPSPFTRETWARMRREQRLTFAWDGVAQSGMAAVVACLNSWNTAEDTIQILTRLRAGIHHQRRYYVAESVADIRTRFARHGRGNVGVLLGLETLTPFASEPGSIETLFGLGVRVAGLTYSEGSILGGGLSSAEDQGLTWLGREFVHRMNDVGMAVDLAHAGDKTTLDVIKLSTAPVMISHAGARGLWPTARMKPDDVLRALADHGGVIGVEAAPNTTCSPRRDTHDIKAVVDHVDFLVDLVGLDHVGLGPDLVFGRHGEAHRVLGLGKHAVSGGRQRRVEYVDGVENPGEAFWNLTAEMIARGYHDDEIVKITSVNGLRLLEGTAGY